MGGEPPHIHCAKESRARDAPLDDVGSQQHEPRPLWKESCPLQCTFALQGTRHVHTSTSHVRYTLCREDITSATHTVRKKSRPLGDPLDDKSTSHNRYTYCREDVTSATHTVWKDSRPLGAPLDDVGGEEDDARPLRSHPDEYSS